MSIKRNFLYNSILTVSGYVFTFATYPYVSRVLGLTNVGIVNFVDGIINYFILFAMMGISTVGIREVAINKTNRIKLSKTFSSIILLNAISTLIAIAILLTAMYTIPQLYPHRQLLYIGICKLVFNSLLVEWFYTGLENFSYITKRTIIIKSVYVASVFLFIHDSSDYQTYYILCVLTVLINGLVNIIYSRKFASLTFNGVSVKPYLSAFFTVGFYIIVTSMYTSFNVAWLGLTAGTDEVGYYTTATKLHTIILALLLAFQNVMFPRVNSLLAEGKHEEYRQKLQLAVDSLLTFAMPIVITSVIFGPNILHFLVGDGFEGSYLPFRIMMPLILVIGYSQITCIRMIYNRRHHSHTNPACHKTRQKIALQCLCRCSGWTAAQSSHCKKHGGYRLIFGMAYFRTGCCRRSTILGIQNCRIPLPLAIITEVPRHVSARGYYYGLYLPFLPLCRHRHDWLCRSFCLCVLCHRPVIHPKKSRLHSVCKKDYSLCRTEVAFMTKLPDC